MAQTQPQSGRGEPAGRQSGTGNDVGGGPRILRIGIVQGGKVVEERLVRKREDITIGQSAKNTFVVPASNVLPRSFTLFALSGNTFALNFTEGMDGRVAAEHNAAPQTLAQLRTRAQKKGDAYHLVLPDKSRGKVVIGDTTVLFQFVTPPPVQPRPQLPPSVRGSVWQNLDWVMIAIVALSMISHAGFVIYLRTVDWPRKPDIEEIPDRFVQMIVPQKKEEPKVEKVDPNAAKTDEKSDEKKAKKSDEEKPKKPEVTAEEKARREAERRARLAQQVASMGALKLLGAKGANGTLADMLKSGDPGGDADRVFGQGLGGVGVAGAGGGLRGAKGAGGTGTAQGIEGLRAQGVGAVGTGDRGAERVATMRGSVKDVERVDVDGELDPDAVAKLFRQRKGAIIACYERALKRNPNLQGKLTLAFTISTIGKVTGTAVEQDNLGDDEVNTCITSTVKTWRFPAAQGGDVRFSYPFVFTASK